MNEHYKVYMGDPEEEFSYDQLTTAKFLVEKQMNLKINEMFKRFLDRNIFYQQIKE